MKLLDKLSTSRKRRGHVVPRGGPVGLGAPLPDDVSKLPTDGVRDFIERYASTHGVQYQRTGLDIWAEAVTRASGDDVSLDSTGELLVALKKKKLLSDPQFSRLLMNHTRELKRVRSVRGLRASGLSPQR